MAVTKQDQRKTQILDSALDVLVEKGYESSRVDDIVARSGISKGAIYWYYPSKKDIYLALVNHWVWNYSATINYIVSDRQSAAEQLTHLFEFFSQQFRESPAVFKALLEFWALANRDLDFRQKLERVYQEFLGIIKAILRQGVERGEFRPLDVETAALSIMVNVEGLVWFAMLDSHSTSVDDYIHTITQFILAGLAPTTQKGDSV
ncbi:MAG: TetR/AcrR family transcriptional regulator [Candidatus Neomarinimicrobiota bacterium]|nr:MAG: TetR/AcrR family transcriptional regulator [Candidatus Neomarinimicrobiota bacterium]